MIDPVSLLVDDIVINLRRSTRRRTLSIEISQQGVVVRAPAKMRQSTIVEFVQSKQHWIRGHIAEMPPPPSPINLTEGARLQLLGKPYTLRLLVGQRGPVSQCDNDILLPVIASHLPQQRTVHRKLVKWYKQIALQEIQTRVDFHAKEMSISLGQNFNIKVRDYKRRWGSCDHRGMLSFNWRIIMAPIAIVDYVVVHELAHRMEFNHSPKFWSIVATQLPNWQQSQSWLDSEGQHLYLF